MIHLSRRIVSVPEEILRGRGDAPGTVRETAMSNDQFDQKYRPLFCAPYVTRDPYEVDFLVRIIREEHPGAEERAISEAIRHALDVMRPPRPLPLFLLKVKEQLERGPEPEMPH